MAQESGPDWRVVVFTNIPGGAVYHLADEVLQSLGHRVVGVVTTPGPGKRRTSDYLSVVAAVRPGIDVIVTTHMDRVAAMIAPLKPDLILSGGFPWLIPPEVIALPALGAINMHPSLLPRHRGPRAIEWAFRQGDPELGFTIHRLDGAFDTGPILAQGSVPLTDEDDFGSLLAKLPAISPGLLREALERVAHARPGDAQDESEATYAGDFEDAWRVIDWTQPARLIHNQVRSWAGSRGMPRGAIAEIEGFPFVITRTQLMAGAASVPVAPGALLSRTSERMVIQCGDDPIELVAWEPVDPRPGTAA